MLLANCNPRESPRRTLRPRLDLAFSRQFPPAADNLVLEQFGFRSFSRLSQRLSTLLATEKQRTTQYVRQATTSLPGTEFSHFQTHNFPLLFIARLPRKGKRKFTLELYFGLWIPRTLNAGIVVSVKNFSLAIDHWHFCHPYFDGERGGKLCAIVGMNEFLPLAAPETTPIPALRQISTAARQQHKEKKGPNAETRQNGGRVPLGPEQCTAPSWRQYPLLTLSTSSSQNTRRHESRTQFRGLIAWPIAWHCLVEKAGHRDASLAFVVHFYIEQFSRHGASCNFHRHCRGTRAANNHGISYNWIYTIITWEFSLKQTFRGRKMKKISWRIDELSSVRAVLLHTNTGDKLCAFYNRTPNFRNSIWAGRCQTGLMFCVKSNMSQIRNYS